MATFIVRNPLRDFFKALENKKTFARGLPSTTEIQDLQIARTFQKLLVEKSISASDVDVDALAKCFQEGWVHSDVVNDQERYVLPSPLHASYLEWKLLPTKDTCPYTTLQELSIAVIQKFSPARLRAPCCFGPAFGHRPNEARYQDEFYRALFEATNGATVASPEYSSPLTSSGRIDFFIPSKKWGIEILRDGKALVQHYARFDATGPYGRWLSGGEMAHYIILDFRTKLPQKRHACKNMSLLRIVSSFSPIDLAFQNMLHVVFKEDFSTVSIYNGTLEELVSFALMENS